MSRLYPSPHWEHPPGLLEGSAQLTVLHLTARVYPPISTLDKGWRWTLRTNDAPNAHTFLTEFAPDEERAKLLAEAALRRIARAIFAILGDDEGAS